MQEQQIDVARVVQLEPSELAERDHRQQVAAGCHHERFGDAGVGDRADLGDHVLERRALQVPSRHPQHRPPAEPPEPGGRAEQVDVGGHLGPQCTAAPCPRRRPGSRPRRDAPPGSRSRPSRTRGAGRPRPVISGRARASRAAATSPTREKATRASSGSGAAANVRPSISGVSTPASSHQWWRGRPDPSATVGTQSSRIASASSSTFQAGSSSAETTTIVLAGRTSPKTSPCALPTSRQSPASVR